MRSLSIIFFCLVISWSTQAQSQQTVEFIDSLTYIQFYNQDYSSLQKTTKEALKKGIDFYFLRTRVAISYYNQKNYESALPHFKKAQEIYPLDTLIQEYYYYTLLFTDREEDAYDLASHFSKSMQEKIGYKKRDYFRNNEITLASGLTSNNNISKFTTLDIKGSDIYSEGTFQGRNIFASIAFKTNLFSRFNLTTGFSYFDNKSLGKIQFKDSTAIKKFRNQPYQFNIALDYLFPSGLKIGGAFGAYYESSNVYSVQFDSNSNTIEYINNRKVNKPFTGSLFLTYRWSRFEAFISGAAGNLASQRQKQGELGFVYYPLGNQNLYTVTRGTIFKNSSENRFIFHQIIGGKAYKFLWYELSGSYGNLQNYIGVASFTTYNTVDPVIFSSHLSLKFFISDFEIIPSYGLQIRENNYYSIDNLFNVNSLTDKYFNHILALTAKWKF